MKHKHKHNLFHILELHLKLMPRPCNQSNSPLDFHDSRLFKIDRFSGLLTAARRGMMSPNTTPVHSGSVPGTLPETLSGRSSGRSSGGSPAPSGGSSGGSSGCSSGGSLWLHNEAKDWGPEERPESVPGSVPGTLPECTEVMFGDTMPLLAAVGRRFTRVAL